MPPRCLKEPIEYISRNIKADVARVEDKAAAEIAQAQAEIARVEDKAAAEIAQAKADVARVEDKRTMSEVFWKAEVERFKREVQLAYTQDYEPYQAALVDKRKKREEPADRRRRKRRIRIRGPTFI
ncbi:hypothetical protein NSK_002083 [Nannochloropsis salina CCMP1776]|uniref:Uncharacterized protein n=1 Tax=Nannochloropsis salina CCMP1776 TaxID=1027361 RepID=A0A4D9D4X9_9STRA|nr:hypothetical protein NSK_002083 [Nannochloropsis salina CCMP1776]|eukprot:TFJ86426.1 hypothetical protein NSK_002083 [Nannochloropsis salina CCMP1776]